MASPARGSHVWVGAESGALKAGGGGVCALCWGDSEETEILVAALDRSVKRFSTEKGKFTEFRDCPGGEGPFCGLATYDSAIVTCVESGLVRVWREEETENGLGRVLRCLRGRVRALQCNPSLPLLASCGLDRCLRLHHLGERAPRHKVYFKSRLTCLLLSTRQDWEAQEEPLPPVEVKEEEGDELWDAMVTVPTPPCAPPAKRGKKRKVLGP
ncbi:WD repeat-containing protein 74 [Pterocles gutturalis]